MITSFKSLGQSGGGGGGYVLPTATPTRLGGVKIGQGINVDSAGTISVSGSDVANYAMALKNMQEGDEDNYKVVNEGGWLYYVEDRKNETENIFVKIKYDADYVTVDMDIDGQTDTDIINIGNLDFGFTISIDSEGNLYYVNENDEDVYFDQDGEYKYGDFSFNWENEGKHIDFMQQADTIEVSCNTENYEYWYCVGQEINIANQDQLGLVKIGEGIDLAEDGTISVDGGLKEVQLPFGSYNKKKPLGPEDKNGGRPLNKGFKFEFNIGNGQWTLNPVLIFCKMYSDVRWNNSAYIDMHLEKKSNDSTPHFYVRIGNNVGSGNQNTKIVDVHIPFDFIQQENSVSYNIPSFTFSGKTSQGTEDYTIEGMVATIKDNGDGGYELIFDNSNCSVENQANTYMNQFKAGNDYFNYNDNVFALAYSFGWDFIANEYNYGVVKVGDGLYIENGALNVEEKLEKVKPTEKRFLICMDGTNTSEQAAPFIIDDEAAPFDSDHKCSLALLYDTKTYEDYTPLFKVFDVWQEGEEGEEVDVTGWTITVVGVPEGYCIEAYNENNGESFGADCFNINSKEGFFDEGAGEMYPWAMKTNNGIVIRMDWNQLELKDDGPTQRGSMFDAVEIYDSSSANMVQIGYICDSDDMEYPTSHWEIITPNL